jgi:hypothetical protein
LIGTQPHDGNTRATYMDPVVEARNNLAPELQDCVGGDLRAEMRCHGGLDGIAAEQLRDGVVGVVHVAPAP